MIIDELRPEIEEYLEGIITSISPLSSTEINKVYRITVADGRTFVAKVADRLLDEEAWMIQYLKEHSHLPVPEVYYSNPQIIIMNFIESDYGVDEVSQPHAAELLAELHSIAGTAYGFERDTLIGPFLQPNHQTENWVDFFSEYRLQYMAQQVFDEGRVDKKFMKKVEKLAAKLGQYITEPNPPSLIHGNVWGGNILSARKEIRAFLNPAIYYADSEMEIAYIRLFNTFGPRFFQRYAELRPIADGFFEVRSHLYSLYYLLMHSRLFGRSYILKAERILDRFV